MLISVFCLFPLLLTACHDFVPLDITTTTLATGRVGEAYADTIRTSGGHGNAIVCVLDGQLPPGIAFRQTGNDAALYGTPQLVGDYLFTVEAVDVLDDSSCGTLVTRGFLLTVQP
jgi:hypothetical protein